MKPVSSRLLASTDTRRSMSPTSSTTANSEAPSLSPPPPTYNSFQDAKRTRESNKPTRVGGGIFRPAGDHTIIGSGDKYDAQLSFATTALPPPVSGSNQKTPVPSSGVSTKPPMTLFDFTRAWESLSSVQDRWELLSVSLRSSAMYFLRVYDLTSSISRHQIYPVCFKTPSRLHTSRLLLLLSARNSI